MAASPLDSGSVSAIPPPGTLNGPKVLLRASTFEEWVRRHVQSTAIENIIAKTEAAGSKVVADETEE